MGQKVVVAATRVSAVGGPNMGSLVGLCLFVFIGASAVLAIALANYSVASQDVQQLKTQGVRTPALDFQTDLLEEDHHQVPYVSYHYTVRGSDGHPRTYAGNFDIGWGVYEALQHEKYPQIIYVRKYPAISDVVGDDPMESRGVNNLLHWIVGSVVLIVGSLGFGVPLLVGLLRSPLVPTDPTSTP